MGIIRICRSLNVSHCFLLLDAELSAHTIVNTWDVDTIANILYDYGEEVKSRSIARDIVSGRPIDRTSQLEEIISRRTSFKERSKTLARCFQALRIVVNDEINALEQALTDVKDIVKPGGRLVILSYHSLEDRRVKRLIREGSVFESDNNPSVLMGSLPWKTVNKRAIPPTEKEIQLNRRARSAKLRAAERFIANASPDQKNNITDQEENEKKTKHLGAKQLRKMKLRQKEEVDGKEEIVS